MALLSRYRSSPNDTHDDIRKVWAFPAHKQHWIPFLTHQYLGIVKTCLQHACRREGVGVLPGENAHSLEWPVPPMRRGRPSPLLMHGSIIPHWPRHMPGTPRNEKHHDRNDQSKIFKVPGIRRCSVSGAAFFQQRKWPYSNSKYFGPYVNSKWKRGLEISWGGKASRLGLTPPVAYQQMAVEYIKKHQ